MTVNTTNSTVDYSGNGVTATFPIPYRFFQDSDIQAFTVVDATTFRTDLTLGVNFTLTGAGSPTVNGTFTMLTGPIPVGTTLWIKRIMQLQQTTDIVNQGPFFPEIHENVFDRLVMQVQQVAYDVSLSVRAADGQNPDDFLDAIDAAVAQSAAFAAASEASSLTSSGFADASSGFADDSAASAAASAASLDEFDDRYLGAKATPPTLDNDGNPLLVGALYWQTGDNEMRVWNGGSWEAFGGAGSINDLFWENATTITSNQTIPAGRNSGTFGPITIADGVTVTVETGATWSIV